MHLREQIREGARKRREPSAVKGCAIVNDRLNFPNDEWGGLPWQSAQQRRQEIRMRRPRKTRRWRGNENTSPWTMILKEIGGDFLSAKREQPGRRRQRNPRCWKSSGRGDSSKKACMEGTSIAGGSWRWRKLCTMRSKRIIMRSW